MVEMVEVIMVVLAEAILEVPEGAVQAVLVAVIPEVLLPTVTVGGVHRIVRVVLVHPAVDLQRSPWMK